MESINNGRLSFHQEYANVRFSQVNPTLEASNIGNILHSTRSIEAHLLQASTASSSQVDISEQARELLANEQAQADRMQANLNQSDQEKKYNSQQAVEQYIYNAQRYSQQNVAPAFIENRAAIEAYSLVQKKVIATMQSNHAE